MFQQIIQEDLLHYAWKTKQIDTRELITTEGQSVVIENWGIHNHDAGPDFFNGRVRIDGTLWVGNIEMHIFSSDWERHSHDCDPAYDNVVLHVVYEEDRPIYNHDEKRIPCIEISHRISDELKENYRQLIQSDKKIPCQDIIHMVEDFTISLWKDRLIAERLEHKATYIKTVLESLNGDWESTFYITLAKYMGSRVNTEPFELMARHLPLSTILKNIDDVQKIEALIFGTAHMLQADHQEEYFQELKSEYQYLQSKYKLDQIPAIMWKFSKMRPPNFPTVRLAQFAQVLAKSPTLFAKVLDTTDIVALKDLFSVSASSYWDDHYRFGTISKDNGTKRLTSDFIDLLIINVIAPILFLYGQEISDMAYCDRAISLLSTLKSEKNSIVKKWKEIGITSQSAAESQALVHLKNNYCDHKKCLSCNIGNKIVHR